MCTCVHYFRKSLQDYSDELKKFAHSIATIIGKILNIEPQLMGDNYAVQALRMNYYPPCTSIPEKVLGFSPHSDGSFFTILTEVNSVKGLQIRRHGAWIPVNPQPKSLLVNVGDFLEVWMQENQLMKLLMVTCILYTHLTAGKRFWGSIL